MYKVVNRMLSDYESRVLSENEFSYYEAGVDEFKRLADGWLRYGEAASVTYVEDSISQGALAFNRLGALIGVVSLFRE